jgi:ribosome-associated heat shock protein Hsp15
VIVRALAMVRRGAPEAQQLYEERADSIARREQAAALRKAGALGVQSDGRPNKKQRRQIHQFRDGQ